MENQQRLIRSATYLLIGAGFVVFGAVFAVYFGVRAENMELWKAMGAHYKFPYSLWGLAPTAVLLLASFFLTWAQWGAQNNKEGERESIIRQTLDITLLLTVGYIVARILELNGLHTMGLFPGEYFSDQLLGVANGHLFVAAHAFVVGVHLLFVLVSFALIARARKAADGFREGGDTLSLETASLFAHFTTIVGIFMLPILYLSH